MRKIIMLTILLQSILLSGMPDKNQIEKLVKKITKKDYYNLKTITKPLHSSTSSLDDNLLLGAAAIKSLTLKFNYHDINFLNTNTEKIFTELKKRKKYKQWKQEKLKEKITIKNFAHQISFENYADIMKLTMLTTMNNNNMKNKDAFSKTYMEPINNLSCDL